jgi:hypothetical protein
MTMLNKNNEQLTRELAFMREEQGMFERRIQAIQGKGNNYSIVLIYRTTKNVV